MGTPVPTKSMPVRERSVGTGAPLRRLRDTGDGLAPAVDGKHHSECLR